MVSREGRGVVGLVGHGTPTSYLIQRSSFRDELTKILKTARSICILPMVSIPDRVAYLFQLP